MQPFFPIAQDLTSPLFGTSPFLPFKFQLRREPVDWRRLHAVDVSRVVREVDVATLQEHVAAVTFCNLDREVCAHCGQPVDPGLLKVLRLAQLSIQYLLHCQDCLSTSTAQLQAQLQASLAQQEQTQQELRRQAAELQAVREESRRRRRSLSMLQQLLQTGTPSSHTCTLCQKAFLNSTYLWKHIQRRHLYSSEKGKEQEQPMQKVIEELQEKLKTTQDELEAQRREAERHLQHQEAEIAHQKDTETEKKIAEWRAKEGAELYEELEKLKHLFWSELQKIASDQSALTGKVQALQNRSMKESNLGSPEDDDSEEQLRLDEQLQTLKEKVGIQNKEWKNRMKQLQADHEAEKMKLQKENKWLREQKQSAVQSQQKINSLHLQIQEQAKIISSQEQKILALSPKGMEGDGGNRKVVDLKEESSEEELEDSRPEQQKILEMQRQKHILMQQLRTVMEEELLVKLENLGIPRDVGGISPSTFSHLESHLKALREQKAAKNPELKTLREQLIKKITRRVKEMKENEAGVVKTKLNPLVTEELEPKDRILSKTLPPKLTESPRTCHQSHGSHGPGMALVPIPTPRSRTYGHSSAPALSESGLRDNTPPFSSEEDPVDFLQSLSLQSPRHPSWKSPRLSSDYRSDSENSDLSAQNDRPGRQASTGTRLHSVPPHHDKDVSFPVAKPDGHPIFVKPKSLKPPRAATLRKFAQLSDESDSDISLEDLLEDQLKGKKPSTYSEFPGKFGAEL
ncbi:cilium assembly protein DZIP1L [Erinaceus europaeus]|uniref:Cilium assembly protein DZIP1L n=1 Tax=Erinaceus europaeus TaxID=9365 RepID=A0A1S3W5Z8_ERIEU|nr:cilium assembly protein DZIP1L [Erinaceus europaeus]